MLYIETEGSPMEMGRSYGEAFQEELRACVKRYSPWLLEHKDRFMPAVHRIRRLVQRHSAELWDETVGMSEGSEMDMDVLLGYRFFTDVRMHMEEGCSVVFFAESDRGPLLGRNCDLSPAFDPEIQTCHISRPRDAMDTITVGYLGLPGPPGLNEAGLAKGGASAHTEIPRKAVGLPGALLGGRLLYGTTSVQDALGFLRHRKFLGKPLNLMVGDGRGNSAVLEFAPGRVPVVLKRLPEMAWQACTNFFSSGRIPMAPEREYLQSAYARYGRIHHKMQDASTPRTLEGMKELLRDVAQPGLCSTGLDGQIKTAYSHISELAHGRIHLAPGHPVEVGYEEMML